MSPLMDEEQFERQLNRLVDGELNGVEYRQLLATLDAAPEGWRRCALAFLESQALSRDLFSVARDPAPRWSAMLAAANAPIVAKEKSAHGARPDQSRSSRAGGGSDRSTYLRWAALAASWLVVFAVGWNLSRPKEPEFPQVEGNLPSANVGLKPSVVERLAEPVAASPSMNLEPRASGPRNQVPARETYATDELSTGDVPPEYHLPPSDIREDVRARGLDVRERQLYVPVEFNGGQRYVVPIYEYQVAPWKKPAY